MEGPVFGEFPLHPGSPPRAAPIFCLRKKPARPDCASGRFSGSRGAQRRLAAGIIIQALDNDPDVQVKKQAVSALSQLPGDEGIPLLIKLARSHTNPVVRKQAMQRLGQSNDPRALSFFEEVLR